MSITFNLVSPTAAASAVFVEEEAVQRGTGSAVIPRKILIPGQFNSGFSPTVNKPQLILSESDAWSRYGRGSMLSRMIKVALDNSGGVSVYALPLADADGSVAAVGSIAVTGAATETGTLAIYVGGTLVSVAVTSGDDAATVGEAIASAINAKLDLPVTASHESGTVTVTVRWKGASGNQIKLETNLSDDDSTPDGLGITVTDIGSVTSGSVDPSVADALASLGNTWYTDIAFPYLSDTALSEMESAGDDRDDPGVKRPFVGIVGYTDTYANFLTELESRNSQWTTFVPVHGSSTSAYMIAASACAIFAQYQQSTPGRPMKTLEIPDVLAGDEDLTYTQRDAVVKAGGSHTFNQEDGTVTFGDLCTTKTMTSAGVETTDWRFTIIIPNIQFKMYALEQAFLDSPFDRGVVVANGGGSVPSYAVTPNMVKARAFGLIEDWESRGLSTDIDTIKEGVTASINDDNPGRIDLLIPDIASAGLRILAVKLEWGYLV